MSLSAGDVIKLARQKQGMTQSELGELLGVGKSTIQKYENGYVTNIKLDTIRNICRHLDIWPAMMIFSEEIYSTEPDLIFSVKHSTLHDILRLNQAGQCKVHEYILDLLCIEKYQKK